MSDYLKRILTGQFEASLCMLNECIVQCPEQHWDGKIAKYPFWQVAYHTLCFLDLYLSPSEAAFAFRDIHTRRWADFNDEYPSRRFDKAEITGYVALCHRKGLDSIASETRESLEGPSGFPRLAFARGELHLYNIRHVQHHTGQLSAWLRQFDVDNKWVKTGWPSR